MDQSKPKSLHHTGRNYLASVISIQGLGGLDFNMVYHGNFFTQQFFTSLTSIDSWAMSPQAQPIPSTDTNSVPALHIYDFFAGVQSIPLGAPAIPADGFSLIQARQLGNLIFHSFAVLDIKENVLACPFASSLLGSRLERWLRLLDLPQVQVVHGRRNVARHPTNGFSLAGRSYPFFRNGSPQSYGSQAEASQPSKILTLKTTK
jgi:hypothetical protein